MNNGITMLIVIGIMLCGIVVVIVMNGKGVGDGGFNLGEAFELKTGEKAACMEEGLEVEVRNIVTEQIEAAPGNEESYPSGSGVTVTLVLKKGGDTKEIMLTKLSEGYESKDTESWNGYTISLIRAMESAMLKVDR